MLKLVLGIVTQMQKYCSLKTSTKLLYTYSTNAMVHLSYFFQLSHPIIFGEISEKMSEFYPRHLINIAVIVPEVSVNIYETPNSATPLAR
jgi:hypothetical protein